MAKGGGRRTVKAKAIIFDLDGCLVDSELLCISAITEEMRDIGMRSVTIDDILSRFLGVSMRVICDYVTQQTGLECPPDFVNRVEQRLFADYRKHLRQIDGATSLLQGLQTAGIPFAIATGGSVRRMTETLNISGLAPWFEDRAFSADQVDRGKPAPDLFLFAANALGIAPADCLVIEDSPHGIEGARAAGMQAIGFIGGAHLQGKRDQHSDLLAQKGAMVVASALDEIATLVQSDIPAA